MQPPNLFVSPCWPKNNHQCPPCVTAAVRVWRKFQAPVPCAALFRGPGVPSGAGLVPIRLGVGIVGLGANMFPAEGFRGAPARPGGGGGAPLVELPPVVRVPTATPWSPMQGQDFCFGFSEICGALCFFCAHVIAYIEVYVVLTHQLKFFLCKEWPICGLLTWDKQWHVSTQHALRTLPHHSQKVARRLLFGGLH